MGKGYNWETGECIEIEKGNLVRPGHDIEVYDNETGEYLELEMED